MNLFAHLRRNATRLRRSAWEFAFPRSCLLCGESTFESRLPERNAARNQPTVFDSRVEFCGRCRDELQQPIVARCQRCDAPVGPFLGITQKCIHCRDDRFAFSRIVSIGVYTGRLRAACLRAKQSEGRSLTMSLAELLWEMREHDLTLDRFDAVVPVPVYRWQRLLHGEGAQGTVAEVLAGRMRTFHDRHAVVKRRRTIPQASLIPSKRRTNLRDVFHLRGGAIWRDRRILIVDDVLTTGTTAHQIARLFRDRGAADVVIAVIARGLGDGFKFPSTNVTLSKPF